VSTQIRFLGAAGFEFVGPRKRILIDPYLSGNRLAPVNHEELETPDVILVTHAAFDHLGDTAAIARRTGAPVVCDNGTKRILVDRGVNADQIRAVTWGIVVEIGGVVVRPVECHHRSAGELSDGTVVVDTPLSFIVETEPGCRIYHYGDTCIFDMRLIGELYRPTVGLLGCTIAAEVAELVPGPGRILTGEMDPRECSLAAEMLGVELAIACHYLVPDENVERFLECVPAGDPSGRRRAVALNPGEAIVVEPDHRSTNSRPESTASPGNDEPKTPSTASARIRSAS
jgi:L-ascorbate metabolism protein UlaG (beta-lactamase superfamily)